jgi:PEP-CTERM motif
MKPAISRKFAIILASTMVVESIHPSLTNANATVISPSGLTLVATVDTRGEYNNAGLEYWNGEPLSPSNQPTYQQDQLSATWNFYIPPSAPNILYIIVSDVQDTQYGYISGTPFNLTALTGFELSLPVSATSYATFSNQFAVAGEALLGPTSGSSVPLITTPGWTLGSVDGSPNDANYQIDASNVNYGFTHFSSVYGATRIYGGGVFELSFNSNVNLLTSAKFAGLEATASNGLGSYFEPGKLTYAIGTVPEPSTWGMMLLGFAGLGFAGYRRARRSARLLSPTEIRQLLNVSGRSPPSRSGRERMRPFAGWALRFAKAFSVGLKSGLYGGR